MSVDINSLAFAAKKASQGPGFPPLQHGHALELCAAALGYKTFASYKTAVSAGQEAKDLSIAAHIVPQLQGVLERAIELRPRAPAMSHITWINEALTQCLPNAQLHVDETSLFNTLVTLVDITAVNDGSVSGEMAVSNCDGVREIYLPFDFSLANTQAGEPETLEIDGLISMDIHEERFPIGQKISVRCHLHIEKLGKYLIAEPACHVESAKLIYDWDDDED
ncbi:MAG: hypothetical protein HYX42_13040 [Polaromonas sp.]|uniref:hypothetical protein n=1 Tax=Polaromonas sp. TaxID=1869339 RepID=UPI0025EED84B|nr:hypothetical protein [Polaromonas sp.]MBI2727162.1 hypothetical protein [Polaromonas sp.]